ncbi:HPr family phosphocarrier protein [Paenibacillus arenilitoris]|uniref:HPr family phosphocarrier protein n=1 Tax=Paenibacillus arenilitoris TaxID=2772299 RepID=A0A927CUF6_9BACL|nr:HPr family phosphocarrier protein [Paenibacillus arenilitoris]MBD2872421.1 HPr family phosphocarrier protein [Paenibacillus arenilitoris]
MVSQTFTILNPTGFHVRPTKTFVQTASAFPCKINVINKGKKVNGKSSLSMLTLGIAANEEVTLEIDGEQEQQALETLGKLLTEIHE